MRKRTTPAVKKLFEFKPNIPIEFLNSPDSIVEFSFVAQNSLTSLDLSRSELSRFKEEVEISKYRKDIKMDSKFELFSDKFFKDTYVDTEEACKKRLATNRYLLYKFHLDVSKDLEFSLRNSKKRKLRKFLSDNVLLNRVAVAEKNSFQNYLNRILERGLEQSNQKVKLISHICKLAKNLKFISENSRIRDRSLTFLCFQRADPAIVKDFLSVMNFGADHFYNYSVDIFEFVLHHANRNGIDLWGSPPTHDPIHVSISYRMFVKTQSLFVHYSAPSFCQLIYTNFLDGGRLSLPKGAFQMLDENGLIPRDRLFLILELLHVFWIDPNNGLKALQMVWRSVPEPLVTLNELKLTLSKVPKPEVMTKFCGYIKKVTGEEVLEEFGPCPRKLKHYCRIAIRDVLSNNRKLAEGISVSKLPPSLKSYLKLES